MYSGCLKTQMLATIRFFWQWFIIMYQPQSTIKRAWLPYVAAALFLTFLFTFFHYLAPMLSPFIIAAVLAYILDPLVDKLRRFRVNRARGSLWVMLLVFALLIMLLVVIVPMLMEQTNLIIARIPAMVDWVQHQLLPWYNARFGQYFTIDGNTVLTYLRANAKAIQASLQSTMMLMVRQGSSLAVLLGNVMILPLLLYYFLRDWPKWRFAIRQLVPRRYLPTYSRVSKQIDTVLGEFLRGQLLVMLIMGLFYGLGLMFVGLDSGFAIGMVAGLLVFIPYLGSFTGLLLASLAAALQFNAWTGLLAVWAVFAIGQFLESFFITPQIVGDKIGLPPFWVIFSLMAFGQLMGFVGVLLALPLAAICLVVLRESKKAYINSDFYRRRSN